MYVITSILTDVLVLVKILNICSLQKVAYIPFANIECIVSNHIPAAIDSQQEQQQATSDRTILYWKDVTTFIVAHNSMVLNINLETVNESENVTAKVRTAIKISELLWHYRVTIPK